jgi:hypothetical protein
MLAFDTGILFKEEVMSVAKGLKGQGGRDDIR